MSVISIPPTPTFKEVNDAIELRWDHETTRVRALNWTSLDDQSKADNSVAAAHKSAVALLAAIKAIGADAPADQSKFTTSYQQAWLNLLASIIKNGNSPETRQSVLDQAQDQMAASYQTFQSTVQNAPTPDQAVEDALEEINQVISFTQELGTVAVAVPLKSAVSNVLSRDYPGLEWNDLTPPVQDNVLGSALADIGFGAPLVASALKWMGRISLGLSVIFAFWDASDGPDATYSLRLSKSLVDVGVSWEAGAIVSDAFEDSDAATVMGMVWGAEGDLAAALIPTGFGIVVGLAVTAIADAIFDLIFGTGVDIPAQLRVAITLPITVPITL
jgi:hypothetical protein